MGKRPVKRALGVTECRSLTGVNGKTTSQEGMGVTECRSLTGVNGKATGQEGTGGHRVQVADRCEWESDRSRGHWGSQSAGR